MPAARRESKPHDAPFTTISFVQCPLADYGWLASTIDTPWEIMNGVLGEYRLWEGGGGLSTEQA